MADSLSAAKTWLDETSQLDLSHPRLRITAHKLTQSRQTVPARAAAIQDFVRRLPFAASATHEAATASAVLQRGRGDCHSKALLFTALCRAAGLPARVLFVRVRTRFLQGLLEEPPEAMTHALAQVHVGQRWVSTDGYVVDPLLFARAKHLLRVTGRECGWGIVREASGHWDGQSPCIQQFRGVDVLATYGAFDDVREFRATRLGGEAADWKDAVRHALGARLVNWRVARLRSDRPRAAA